MRFQLAIIGVILLLTSAGPPAALAQTRTQKQRLDASAEQARPRGPAAVSAFAQSQRMNAWTVGLAAGRTEGAPLQFAAELARVLDDGDDMRVLPIVTRGAFDNVYDLLYLRGVDAAIVYGDVLDHFKSKTEFSDSSRRINYLLSLFPSEVHLFARPEINSLQDLAGKVVNFNTPGTAAHFSGPIIFKQLGIEVKATFVPHSVAMEKMRQGPEVAATFWISSKPLAPFLKGKWPEGFKFLPVDYSDRLPGVDPTKHPHRNCRGASRAGGLRLAAWQRPLSAPGAAGGLYFCPDRETAEGTRLSREMARREYCRQGTRLEALPAGPGQARQGHRRGRIFRSTPRGGTSASQLNQDAKQAR
jgi:hypothetical protein